jgi:hypothetical protein
MLILDFDENMHHCRYSHELAHIYHEERSFHSDDYYYKRISKKSFSSFLRTSALFKKRRKFFLKEKKDDLYIIIKDENENIIKEKKLKTIPLFSKRMEQTEELAKARYQPYNAINQTSKQEPDELSHLRDMFHHFALDRKKLDSDFLFTLERISEHYAYSPYSIEYSLLLYNFLCDVCFNEKYRNNLFANPNVEYIYKNLLAYHSSEYKDAPPNDVIDSNSFFNKHIRSLQQDGAPNKFFFFRIFIFRFYLISQENFKILNDAFDKTVSILQKLSKKEALDEVALKEYQKYKKILDFMEADKRKATMLMNYLKNGFGFDSRKADMEKKQHHTTSAFIENKEYVDRIDKSELDIITTMNSICRESIYKLIRWKDYWTQRETFILMEYLFPSGFKEGFFKGLKKVLKTKGRFDDLKAISVFKTEWDDVKKQEIQQKISSVIHVREGKEEPAKDQVVEAKKWYQLFMDSIKDNYREYPNAPIAFPSPSSDKEKEEELKKKEEEKRVMREYLIDEYTRSAGLYKSQEELNKDFFSWQIIFDRYFVTAELPENILETDSEEEKSRKRQVKEENEKIKKEYGNKREYYKKVILDNLFEEDYMKEYLKKMGMWERNEIKKDHPTNYKEFEKDLHELKVVDYLEQVNYFVSQKESSDTSLILLSYTQVAIFNWLYTHVYLAQDRKNTYSLTQQQYLVMKMIFMQTEDVIKGNPKDYESEKNTMPMMVTSKKPDETPILSVQTEKEKVQVEMTSTEKKEIKIDEMLKEVVIVQESISSAEKPTTMEMSKENEGKTSVEQPSTGEKLPTSINVQVENEKKTENDNSVFFT